MERKRNEDSRGRHVALVGGVPQRLALTALALALAGVPGCGDDESDDTTLSPVPSTDAPDAALTTGDDRMLDAGAPEDGGETTSSDGANSADGSTSLTSPDAGDAEASPLPVESADVAAAAQALMQEAHFPGLALSTFDAKGVTWSVGMGFADSKGERQVTPDTSFWLASVSKPITGLALLRASEETDLTLDSKIASLLEDNDKFTLASTHAEDTTIANLVTHHSPIRDSATYECGYYLGTEAEHTSLANLFDPEATCDDSVPVELGGFLENYLSVDGAYYLPDNFADDLLAELARATVRDGLEKVNA